METVKGYTVEDFLKMSVADFLMLDFTKEELDKAMKMIDEHGSLIDNDKNL